MPNAAFAFGIDLSKYNTSQDGRQRVAFDTIAAHQPQVCFIAMRAGISWGYQDPWFAYYFAETARIGRVRLAYHVLYPAQPAQAQMDNFFRILGAVDFAAVPLVLDLELDHGQTPNQITRTTADCVAILFRRTGRIPILYSRALWVNQHLRVGDLPVVHWWLAQYRYARPYPLYTPEYPCPPTLPQGVHTWLIHQTASRGRSIGAPALHYMDFNRFNGDEGDLLRFIGDQQPVPVTCPLDDQPCTGGKFQERIG